MKKKGFTLIELLAVIVILAIIALIATPIVLNIINDAKESATLRSADFYLEGVETSIATSVLKNIQVADGIYSIMQDGNLCIGTLTNNTCTGSVLKVEMDGEVPINATVIIKDGSIEYATLEYESNTIIRNYDGKTVRVLKKMCELVSDSDNSGTITPGDKYKCEVKEGTSFNFYVLSTYSGKIDLIMERNICDDGTVATSNKTCLIEWISRKDYDQVASAEYNSEYPMFRYPGPVTAMNYLYKATRDWHNVPNYVVKASSGWGGYFNTHQNGILTQMIDSYTNKAVPVNGTDEGYINLKVHLPDSGLVQDYCGYMIADEVDCPIWLVDFLEDSENIKHENITKISGINSYWLSGGYNGGDDAEVAIIYNGTFRSTDSNELSGVRPVITITEDNIAK